jgi:hypothetical protein
MNTNRTVVITVETQPNFTSGAAAWTPDDCTHLVQTAASERLLGGRLCESGSRMVRRQQRPDSEDQLLVSMITRESRRVGSERHMN